MKDGQHGRTGIHCDDFYREIYRILGCLPTASLSDLHSHDAFVYLESYFEYFTYPVEENRLGLRDVDKGTAEPNTLPKAIQVLSLAVQSGFRLVAADPAYRENHHDRLVSWTPNFVGEIRRGLKACRIILCFIVFYLCLNQVINNIISQSGEMETSGLSNDTIQSLNPLACIILGPIIQKGLFPYLTSHHIPFRPIARITVAIMFILLDMAYAAGIQKFIYSHPPCHYHPLSCPAASLPDDDASRKSNNVCVWGSDPCTFLTRRGSDSGLGLVECTCVWYGAD